ncbi:hypothetical protein BSZ35_04065 [Salinibacter sp. 10B]|uniref:protein phosphatase 2C domain-containing protein n=1 Tax=Salinibacter sp. 10B TaxID=1923971 RepID=UPI000CF52FD6|nr:protein phosphatase 2C domain-containing protein [Salinibacter sp. 10B]PQJ33886.1 hypothetical protein BSZ35_04065 [Salinibacter sp. 10B]
MSEPSTVHRIHAVPRAGGEAGDYEDAVTLQVDEWPVCAAVADGATESVFARQWAKTLVDILVDTNATRAEDFPAVVAEGQRQWQTSIGEREDERPWYVTAKAAEGAYATLLGVSVHSDGTWRAVSVGDCCLFHVHGEQVRQTWPLDHPEAFTNRPALLSSQQGASMPSPRTASGSWTAGGALFLATDAVAAWLLRRRASGKSIAEMVQWDSDTFRDCVAAARERGTLRNDDSTLLVLDLPSSPKKNGPSPE